MPPQVPIVPRWGIEFRKVQNRTNRVKKFLAKKTDFQQKCFPS